MRISRQEGNWTEVASATVRKLLLNYPRPEKNTNFLSLLSEDEQLNYPPVFLNTAIAGFMVLAVLGMIGNAISYFALAKNSKLKHFTTSLFVNISAVDLFISCLFGLMLSIFFLNHEGRYTDDMCKMFAYVRYAGSMACMFMLTAIVFNRFVYLAWTRKYPELFTSSSICMTTLFFYIFPLALMLFPLLGKGGRFAYDSVTGTCDLLYNNMLRVFALFLIFILCPMIIVICYVRLSVAVLSRRCGWTCCASSENPNAFPLNRRNRKWADQDPSKDGSEGKLLLFIFVIFVITLACYVPVFFVRTVRNQEDYYVKHIFLHLLFFFSSAVKPVMYYAMSKNYRTYYKKLFTRDEDYEDNFDIFNIQLSNVSMDIGRGGQTGHSILPVN